jgi:hypothetical protein
VEQRAAGVRTSEAPLADRLATEDELEDPALVRFHPALAQADPLRERVHAAIAPVEHQLDVAGARRPAAEALAGGAIGEGVAHEGLVQ